MDLNVVEGYILSKKYWDDINEVKIEFKKRTDINIDSKVKNGLWKISISDFFCRMPDSDAKILFDMYARFLEDSTYKVEYGKVPYVYSRQIAIDNQSLYLDRMKIGWPMTKGNVYDLESMASGLVARGLIDRSTLENTVVTYVNSFDERDKWGDASPLLRFIRIDYGIDSVEIPQIMVEYTLYHELLHVEMAMETLYDPHGQDFMNRMRAYDRRKELLEWARCKGITEEQLDTYL